MAMPGGGGGGRGRGGGRRGGRGRGGRNEPPPDAFALSGEERLQKFLSHSGIDSRRQCEQMILDGRVRVNGKMVKNLGVKVKPESDQVHVDGNRVYIRPASEVQWIALNKPKGVICTVSDELGRPTVVDAVPGGRSMKLVPVGRLDRDSCGLILLTNENSWINPLTHPSYGHEKTYRVSITSGYPTNEEWNTLTNGMLLEGDPNPTRPCLVEVVDYDRRTRMTAVDIIIREGKNRQIRRMFEGIGHDVRSITRVSHGPIRIKNLRPGEWRRLETWEVEKLKNLTTKTLKVPEKLRKEKTGATTGGGSSTSSLSSGGHGPFSRQQRGDPHGQDGRKRDEIAARNQILDEEEAEWNMLGPAGDAKRPSQSTKSSLEGSRAVGAGRGSGMSDRDAMRMEDDNHEWYSTSWARGEEQQPSGSVRRKKKSKGGKSSKPETEGDIILRKLKDGVKMKAPLWEGAGRVERETRKTTPTKPWASRRKGSWSSEKK